MRAAAAARQPRPGGRGPGASRGGGPGGGACRRSRTSPARARSDVEPKGEALPGGSVPPELRLGPGLVFRQGGEVAVGDFQRLCRRVGWRARPDWKVAEALKGSCELLPRFFAAGLVPFPRGRLGVNDRRPSGLTNRAEIDLVTSLHLEEEGAAEPGLLVGVARVTSDGVFNATLWDVMVSRSALFPSAGECAWNATARMTLQHERAFSMTRTNNELFNPEFSRRFTHAGPSSRAETHC